MSGNLHIYLRGADHLRIAEVDDFQKLTIVEKFDDLSTWELVINSTSRLAGQFQPGTGILVTQDGLPNFGGPLSIVREQYQAGKFTTTINGFGDEVYLQDRLALPTRPDFTHDAAFSGDPYDQRIGAAETVIKGYVAANATATGWDPRQALANLAIAPDLGRGLTVTVQARFQNLRELIAAAALDGGDLGFYLRQLDENKPTLTFDVFQPVDRTATARFSLELGNLSQYDYQIERPAKNHELVAGQGQGVARQIAEGTDDASVALWGWISSSLNDRRDTADMNVLRQEVTASLASNAVKTVFDFTALDTYLPDGRPNCAYGVTYNVGDRVTAMVNGVEITQVVRSVERDYTTDAPPRVKPMLGTPNSFQPKVLRLLQHQRAMMARVTNLERSL